MNHMIKPAATKTEPSTRTGQVRAEWLYGAGCARFRALSIYDEAIGILVQHSRINVQLRGTRTFIRDASRAEVMP